MMTTTLDESFRYCRRVARRTGRNFYFTFLTLPGDLFRDTCALYAFMRHTDDLADSGDPGLDVRREWLARWRAALDAALTGEPAEGLILPALADVVARRGVPHQYLHEVIAGVESDLAPRTFATFDDLARYCYQVAGAVGLCCIHIWGFRDDRALPPAVACGQAFQLTNILRDLGEDARAGRVYLPDCELRQFGYSPANLRDRVLNPQFRDLMRYQVERARDAYARGEELLNYLDRPGRCILTAMLGIYGGLLDTIERRRYDVFSRRIRLSAPRKAAIAARSMLWPRRPGSR
jgi:phytoene synthase